MQNENGRVFSHDSVPFNLNFVYADKVNNVNSMGITLIKISRKILELFSCIYHKTFCGPSLEVPQ